MAVNVGDIFYYGMILVQPSLIWYLGASRRIRHLWLFLPTLVLSVVVYSSYVYNIWHTKVTLSNGALNYTWPTWGLRLDAVLSTLFIVTGALIIRLIGSAQSGLGRLRIALLAAAFIGAGLIALDNTLLLRGLNNSPVIYVAYLAIFGMLLVLGLTGQIRHS